MPVRKTTNAIRWLLRPFLLQRRQYWRVVLVCFLAASTFWLLNALNQDHTTRITYPIQFVYDEDVLMPLHPLPNEVTLNVTGKGWNLLRRQLGILEVQPVRLVVQNLPEATYLTGQTISPALRKTVRRFALNYVVTDTINFRFDRRVSRRLKLVADSSSLHLAPGYQLSSPIMVVPNEVEFSGPSFLLDTLPENLQLRLPRKSISSDFNSTISLPYLQNPLIKSNLKQAAVTFQVKKQQAAATPPPSPAP